MEREQHYQGIPREVGRAEKRRDQYLVGQRGKISIQKNIGGRGEQLTSGELGGLENEVSLVEGRE